MVKLTPREVEVLDYICQGYSNRQIAEKLIINTHTAKAHVTHILEKFEVKSRVRLAYINGVLERNSENK